MPSVRRKSRTHMQSDPPTNLPANIHTQFIDSNIQTNIHVQIYSQTLIHHIHIHVIHRCISIPRIRFSLQAFSAELNHFVTGLFLSSASSPISTSKYRSYSNGQYMRAVWCVGVTSAVLCSVIAVVISCLYGGCFCR